MGRPGAGTAVAEADRLRALLDAASDAVLLVDEQWRVRYANRSMQRLLGQPARLLVDRPIHALFPDLDDQAFAASLSAAIRAGDPWRHEAWLPPLAGWFVIDVTPGDGLTAVFLRDVTDRRRRELAADVHAEVEGRLVATLGPLETMVALARALRGVTGFDFAEVWIADGSEGRLRLIGHDQRDRAELRQFARDSEAFALSEASAAARALASRDVVTVDDVTAPGDFERHAVAAAAGLRSSIHIPVVEPGLLPAVVGLYSCRPPGDSDWPTVLRHIHRQLRRIVVGQRERHDFEQVFELAGDPVVVARLDGELVRVNPHLGELVGRPPGELVGASLADLAHPANAALVRALLHQLGQGRTVTGVRIRHEGPDGRHRTLAWNAQPVPGEGIFYATGRDVTDWLVGQELEAAQRATLQGMVVGAPLADTLERIVRSLEARLPAAHVSIHVADDRGAVLSLIAGPSLPVPLRSALAEIDLAAGETVCGAVAAAVPGTPADGAHPTCWSVPVHGTDGALLGAIGVHRAGRGEPDDAERQVVSDQAQLVGLAIERQRTASRLEASHEQFRLLAQATSDTIYDVDLLTGQVTWSRQLEEQFGHDHADAGADETPWSHRLHPEDHDQILAEVAAAIAGEGSVWTATYRFLRGDGTYARVADRGTILRDPDGRATRMVGGMVDVSEEHEREHEYLRAQRLESIGTLAGGLAHDLNNLLAPIVMAADLLALSELTGEQRDLVDTVALSADRGAQVVRQVLTFARGAEVEHAPVDPRELVAAVRDIAQDTFPRSITVEVLDDPEPWIVVGDDIQLQQVLVNLAVNARDAMPDGGTLSLGVANVMLDEAFASMRPGAVPGPHVRLQVRDTGEGLTGEVRERLFEPFFSTKPTGQGTGLGLPTALSIVRSHRGFVEARGEPGLGSTFEVYLPASADERPRQPGGERPTVRRTGNGELVLVVDDEAAVRTVTEQTLRAHGYRVVTAADGAEAVASFARQRREVALVLTDLMMPVMDGHAAIQAIRRLEPDVPVVAVSGVADRQLDAREEGWSAVLAKPFTAATLLQAVAVALEAR